MRNVMLGAVLARSDSDVWVGGGVRNSKGGYTEAVGHWNGHAWSMVTLPVSGTTGQWHVNSIVPDGSGGLWALGYCMATCGVHPSRIWHEADGRWTGPVVPSWEVKDSALDQLAATGHSVWGVGRVNNNGIYAGLIVRNGPVPG